MFARYFVEVGLEPAAVIQLLTQSPESWLPGLAAAATHQGDLLLANVGFGHDVRIERTVEIQLGTPVDLASRTLIPLRWTPIGTTGLFPSLDADLEVAPITNGRTQLALSARYVPPLGALGRVLDRAVLSRVAEATVKDFLDRVAEGLRSDHGLPGAAAVH